MAKYAAVCNRFPELQIGTTIKFSDGSFETDDDELWAELQKNEWWNVHIHLRDTPPPPESQTPAEPTPDPPSPTEAVSEEEPDESRSPRVRHGGRGSRG